jgi:hypothetical protein
LPGTPFRQLAESVHPLALGNVKRSIEQIWQLAKKLIRLHSPDVDDAELATLVMRLTTELYSHSQLLNRVEAAALGLPVVHPPEGVEDRLLAYYGQPKTDLELLEKFDPGALLESQQQPDQLPVVLERAYIETPTTCDSFVTRRVVSRQPRLGQQREATMTPATLEVMSERWEAIA